SLLAVHSRRSRWLGAALGLCALVLLSGAAPPKTATVVETQRLNLRDAQGKLRAELGTRPDGSGSLSLAGAAREGRRHVVRAAGGCVGLVMSDKQGHDRVALYVNDDGSPVLSLADGAGKERAALVLSPQGAPLLQLSDKEGRVRARYGLRDGDGGAVLHLVD